MRDLSVWDFGLYRSAHMAPKTRAVPLDDHAAPEELSRAQCLELLASVPVGRISGSMDAMPYVFPVNFAVAGEKVLIRTRPGTKRDAAMAGNVVAFEADEFGSDGSWGWSVLARGIARTLSDGEGRAAAQAVGLRSFAYTVDPDHFLQISIDLISGRRFDHRTQTTT